MSFWSTAHLPHRRGSKSFNVKLASAGGFNTSTKKNYHKHGKLKVHVFIIQRLEHEMEHMFGIENPISDDHKYERKKGSAGKSISIPKSHQNEPKAHSGGVQQKILLDEISHPKNVPNSSRYLIAALSLHNKKDESKTSDEEQSQSSSEESESSSEEQSNNSETSSEGQNNNSESSSEEQSDNSKTSSEEQSDNSKTSNEEQSDDDDDDDDDSNSNCDSGKPSSDYDLNLKSAVTKKHLLAIRRTLNLNSFYLQNMIG